MKVYELYKNINRENLFDYLIINHYKSLNNFNNKNIENIKTKINETIDTILNLENVETEEYKDFVVFVIKTFDDLSDDSENFDEVFDVFGCYKNEILEKEKTLDFYKWDDIINNEQIEHWGIALLEKFYIKNFEIADICINKYGNIVVAGELFWEITFFGYEDSSIEKFKKELIEQEKRIESGEEKLLDIDDVFKSFDENYTPPTKEEDEQRFEQMKKISTKNRIIYNQIFKEFISSLKK